MDVGRGSGNGRSSSSMVFRTGNPNERYVDSELHETNLDSVAVYMTISAGAYFTVFALAKLGVMNAMITSSLKGNNSLTES